MIFQFYLQILIIYLSSIKKKNLKHYLIYKFYLSTQMQDAINWAEFVQQSIRRLKSYQSSQWIKCGDSPCLMYTMEVNGRVASKGELQVQFSIDTIETVLSDSQTQKKLADNLQSVTTLKQGQGFKINLMKYKAIWPVSPRDFVMCAAKRREGEILYVASRSAPYKCQEQPGTVRAECYVGGYIVQKLGENRSKVVYISDADLQGSIPGMIKNKLSKAQGLVPSKLNELLKKSGK